MRYADFVVLNKCDLVGPVVAAAIEEKIRAISEAVRIVRAAQAEFALPLVLSAGLFQSDRYLADHDHDHLAADGFDAVSFETARRLRGRPFPSVSRRIAGKVFRGKGSFVDRWQ